ncbi:hypothetical protein GGR56DRAFT_609492 [Xylariaceae sp. FL0804]|nr:hypothetical protein GGR56DRAFT_609492 [Xylariaceae sp. FL0804]
MQQQRKLGGQGPDKYRYLHPPRWMNGSGHVLLPPPSPGSPAPLGWPTGLCLGRSSGVVHLSTSSTYAHAYLPPTVLTCLRCPRRIPRPVEKTTGVGCLICIYHGVITRLEYLMEGTIPYRRRQSDFKAASRYALRMNIYIWTEKDSSQADRSFGSREDTLSHATYPLPFAITRPAGDRIGRSLRLPQCIGIWPVLPEVSQYRCDSGLNDSQRK